MNVVELCPLEGQTRADFLAAGLVYKMIGYRFCDKK
jgi:agmatinase